MDRREQSLRNATASDDFRALELTPAARAAGKASVDHELAMVGLSRRAGWYTAAWLYSTGATLFLAVSLLDPGRYPLGSYALALAGYALAIFSVVGARIFENSTRAIHIRLWLGISTLLAGAFLLGPGRSAFPLFTMFMLVTPALLYGPRFAVPYSAYTITFVFVTGLFTEGETFARVWITCAALWMVAIGLMVARWRAQKIATANAVLANTDALTGLRNTRRLHDRIAELLDQSGADPQPFTLFALDLDDFKQVNDRLGHTTGDRVLVAVADALDALVDENGLVARRGGDEFSLLVPGLDQQAAEELRDRTVVAIRLARLATCPEVSPSGSVAFVQSRPDDTIASLMRRADDALHAEKVAFHATQNVGGSKMVPAIRPGDTCSSHPDDPTSTRVADHGAGYSTAASARSTEIATSANQVWLLAAAILAPIALVLASMAVPGMLRPLTPLLGGVIAIGLLALSAACVVAHRHNLNVNWLHLPFVLATVLLVVAIGIADGNGGAIINLLPVIGLYAFFFFRPGIAALYLISCLAIYAVFEIGGAAPYGLTRTVVSGVSMLIVMTAVIKIRAVTQGFAVRHRELSEIDALTGVANIRSMKHRLNSAIANVRINSQGEAVPPILIALDLDDFKSVNDRFNHTVGDQTIAAVAHAIGETMRGDDFVARRGGDEFFVLTSSLEYADLPVVVDRLREAINYARRRICPELEAGVTIATAVWHASQSADEFMQSADSELHDAKRHDRLDYGDGLLSIA